MTDNDNNTQEHDLLDGPAGTVQEWLEMRGLQYGIHEGRLVLMLEVPLHCGHCTDTMITFGPGDDGSGLLDVVATPGTRGDDGRPRMLTSDVQRAEPDYIRRSIDRLMSMMPSECGMHIVKAAGGPDPGTPVPDMAVCLAMRSVTPAELDSAVRLAMLTLMTAYVTPEDMKEAADAEN